MDHPRAKRLLSVAVACATLAATALDREGAVPRACAQGAEPGPAEIERLRLRFREAIALEEQGKWEQALAIFEEIAAVKATPPVIFHVALAMENVGRLREALDGYDRAASLAESESDTVLAEKAKTRAAALRERIPKLRVVLGEGVSGSLTLDGTTWPLDRVGKDVPVDLGKHELSLSRPGKPPRVKTFYVAENERLVVSFEPLAEDAPATAPEAAGPPPPVVPLEDGQGGTKVPAIVVGSVGLGALTASGVLFGLSQAAIAEVKDTCDDDLQGCSPDKQDVAERGQRFHYAAIGLAAGGAACLGVATVLWFTVGADRPASPAKPATKTSDAGVRLDVGPTAVMIRGRF